jgi:hypothetical protein
MLAILCQSTTEMTRRTKKGIVIACLVGAAFAIYIGNRVADEIREEKVADCDQTLHAAEGAGEIWTYPPVGFDLDSNLAVKVRSREWKQMRLGSEELASITKAAECISSNGHWWNRPINIIGDDNLAIARYDGKEVKFNR